MLVGCSGWSYEDWVGRFYPVALAKKKEEWLRYYSSYFSTVEINSTYYRIPNDFVVSGWIKKGLTLKDFEYSVRMPMSVTHDSLAKGKGDAAAVQATVFEEVCIKPLAKNDLLGAVLIQLPSGLRNGEGTRRDLRTVLDALDCEKYRYALELHDRSWLNGSRDSLDPEVAEMLRAHNVAAVKVDGPEMMTVEDVTANHSYVHLYGRNADAESRQDKDDELRSAKADYLYSEEELRPWEKRIRRLAGKVEDVRVYFSNHGRAKGPRNALELMDLLHIQHREKDIPVHDQTSLSGFMMYRKQYEP